MITFWKMRLLLLISVSACGGAASAPDDADPGECVVTSTGSGGTEQLVVQMLGTRPVATQWSRDGLPYARWTYAYDEQDRLVRQEHDWRGATSNVPDGNPDAAREVAHDETSAVETWVSLPPSGPGEMVSYVLDPSDRVLASSSETSQTSFDLDALGRLVRIDEQAIDVDSGPYTRLIEYTYEEERLAARSVVDSRHGGTTPQIITYEHEVSANRLAVRRGNRSYAYTSDAGGRVTRIEVDEDGDAAADWVVEAAYAGDATATIVSIREGSVFRTHVFSGACGFSIEVPTGPTVRRRPGAHWNYLAPAVPFAYE